MRAVPLALLVLIALASCSIMHSVQLERAVEKALSADQRTAEFHFEVSLQGEGRVLITGEVDTAQQVADVKEIALAVKGVDKVINMVHVKEPGSGMLQDEVVNTPYL